MPLDTASLKQWSRFNHNQSSESPKALLPSSEAIIRSIASDMGSIFPDQFWEAGFCAAQGEGKSVAPLGGDVPSSTPG